MEVLSEIVSFSVCMFSPLTSTHQCTYIFLRVIISRNSNGLLQDITIPCLDIIISCIRVNSEKLERIPVYFHFLIQKVCSFLFDHTRYISTFLADIVYVLNSYVGLCIFSSIQKCFNCFDRISLSFELVKFQVTSV